MTVLLSKHYSVAAKSIFVLMTIHFRHAAMQCCENMQSEQHICFSKPAVCLSCAVICKQQILAYQRDRLLWQEHSTEHQVLEVCSATNTLQP
jgi:hypothetical protein